MKHFIFLTTAMLLAPLAHAADLNAIRLSDIKAMEMAVPAPAPAPAPDKASQTALDGHYFCYGSSCAITTGATNVCSDGMRIVTQANRSGYTDSDLSGWAVYQRGMGNSTRWSDPSHQNTTATGRVNPFQTAYVVVPRNHRELLHTIATVCVLDTGKCIKAEVLEIGPAFGEISVGAMMQLGLNAHPANGRYEGRISYTFPN